MPNVANDLARGLQARTCAIRLPVIVINLFGPAHCGFHIARDATVHGFACLRDALEIGDQVDDADLELSRKPPVEN
jgi:hypothetical protein